jgi:type IX secretion system PorP/SprF family membrane protein
VRWIHSLILLLLISAGLHSQDPQFSQFYSNPLYLAPSFAGAVEGSRIAVVYRNQWWETTSPFNVYSFSYDHYFATFNSGVGFLAYKDASGTGAMGSLNLGLQYSYNFQLFNLVHVRPGLAFYYLEYGIFDFYNLLFIDQLVRSSVTSGSDAPAEHSRDIDAGSSVLVYTKKLWIGTTVDHMLTPNISLYASEATLPVKVGVYGGYEFRRKGKLLKPSDETMTFAFNYKTQREFGQQLDLGVYWYNYPLVLGLWYRGIPFVNSQRGDAMVFLIGIKTRQFNVGYSYDFTISNLLGAVRGSHEVSMTYKFLLPKRTKKGSVPCPEF